MGETIPRVNERSSHRLGHTHLSFYRNSVHREITRNICQSFIDMPVEWSKTLHFHQINLFVVLFSFIQVCDIWPMIH